MRKASAGVLDFTFFIVSCARHCTNTHKHLSPGKEEAREHVHKVCIILLLGVLDWVVDEGTILMAVDIGQLLRPCSVQGDEENQEDDLK